MSALPKVKLGELKGADLDDAPPTAPRAALPTAALSGKSPTRAVVTKVVDASPSGSSSSVSDISASSDDEKVNADAAEEISKLQSLTQQLVDLKAEQDNGKGGASKEQNGADAATPKETANGKAQPQSTSALPAEGRDVSACARLEEPDDAVGQNSFENRCEGCKRSCAVQ
mmetsp:Transcript_21379/g.38977  ORF Transcript_21379/g.38977 Transcript_21379/m.38977 type:complete len:171 (+) Transcript_21379:55-567(+)